MTPTRHAEESDSRHDEISLITLGSIVLRWRRVIAGCAAIGLLVGLVMGLSRHRVYMSTARFLPQAAETPTSGLAAAATQFGFRVPTSGGAWGPSIYVAILRSRTLLEPIALDTVVVQEHNGKREAVMDLLEIPPDASARRVDRAVRKLSGLVAAEEVKSINAVDVSAVTLWPSVSLALVERLVRGVNQFNLQTRKSQAAAERQFAEARAAETEQKLREAEDRMQSFLQRNRIINPNSEIAFERDRLQREVSRYASVYTSLLQSLEEARLREVRDTPVITLIAKPELPVVPQPRGTVSKAVLGALGGAIIGVLAAFFAHGLSRARAEGSQESREFFGLLDAAKPRFLRRGSP